MKVFAYWNLHKACWSLKALTGPLRGRVVAHAADFELTDCTFKVSEAGRQRVLKERRKNVHAGVVGDLLAFVPAFPDVVDALRKVGNVTLKWPTVSDLEGVPVTYNPYKWDSFVSADLLRSPITRANVVVAKGRRVVAA